jgi:molybdopterin-guanine dinucleotide biosynthesis protein A
VRAASARDGADPVGAAAGADSPEAVRAAGVDAVVLAGGLARRLEGIDKPALEIGGVSLLDRVLDACAEARDVVCVGPRRATRRPVRWTREDPPGAGPVAALAAGLASTSGTPAPRVLLLAADLPFLGPALAHSLWTGSAGHDGAVLVDRDGRDQWLAACYAREVLERAIAGRAAEQGSLAGHSLRRLLAGLDLVRVPDPDGQSFDCDTWEDVDHVRRLVDGGGGGDRPRGTEPDR